jgi:hypothetical protein
MVKPVRALIILAALAGSAAAHASEVACRYEGGVITAPAEVAGIAGDYILDTGDPLSRLHIDRALGEGFDQPTATGDIRFAGQRMTARTLTVTNLDARTYALPTPVAGVIGADVLKDYVVDVSFAPCRVRLSKPGRAPAFRAALTLPLTWRAGLPAAPAAVAGDNGAAQLSMAPSTGSDMTVRLSDAVAAVQHPKKPKELYPGGVGYSRLRAVSFGGALTERPKTALFKAEAGGPDGSLGPDILAAWRLRFDFPRGRLLLAPARRSR